MERMRVADIEAAQALLQRLLTAVDQGELSADTPVGRALAQHMRGALAALDALEAMDE